MRARPAGAKRNMNPATSAGMGSGRTANGSAAMTRAGRRARQIAQRHRFRWQYSRAVIGSNAAPRGAEPSRRKAVGRRPETTAKSRT